MAKTSDDDPLDGHVDFSNVRPNPFARDYARNRDLRVLSPDLLAVFPDCEALRSYIRLTSAAAENGNSDPLDAEIDLSKARPSPYLLGVVDRRCVRLLDLDVAEAFRDDAAVNEALSSFLATRGTQR
jgi:hypothetical protein